MTYQLYGNLTTAKQVIIMSHGFLAKMIESQDYQGLIDQLVAQKKAVISFQYSGMGEESEKIHQYQVEHWQTQLEDIYNEVASTYPNCQIHMFGVSFGNWLIASLITQGKIKPTSAMAIAPVYSSYMSMITGGAVAAKVRGDYQLHHRKVHPSLIDALILASPIYYLENYHVPTCLLWGTLDKTWRYSDVYLMYHHLLDKKIMTELTIIEKGNHTLKNNDEVMTQVVNTVMNWLAQF